MVWCEYRNLRVKECKVGLIGEKKETKETIDRLLNYLHEEDIASAKAYFLSVKEKRPDILMEASDIDGRLHLCLQIISTCEYELASQNRIQLSLKQSGESLFASFSQLNRISTILSSPAESTKYLTSEDIALLSTYSDDAIAISLQLYIGDDALRQERIQQLNALLHRSIPVHFLV